MKPNIETTRQLQKNIKNYSSKHSLAIKEPIVNAIKDKIKEIEAICELTKNFKNFHKNSLPLCAAENVVSDFVKIPLMADFQERYIMGSTYSYKMNGTNFIGSEYLFPYYKMIDELGKELFHAKYTDARTLTGMNAVNVIASSLCRIGDNVMILGENCGGHASMKPTFERLGANVFEAPYDLEKHDFDYDLLNRKIRENNIKFLNIAPSDILFQHDFSKIDNTDCVVLFDYSQTLGLIAAGLLENPLDRVKNCVLFGGTHKTMPGPAHGIIMTNSDELYKAIDDGINPKYLRNIQIHQVISVLFTLIEMKYFGREYQKNTIRIGNLLAKELEKLGFGVTSKNGIYTQTHQIFLEMSEKDMEMVFANATREGITLNARKKAIFRGGFGIRLGVQEISRYNWDDKSIVKIARILKLIAEEGYDRQEVKDLILSLPEKRINFTFEEENYENLW